MKNLLSLVTVAGTLGAASYFLLFSSVLGNFPVSSPQATSSTAPELVDENGEVVTNASTTNTSGIFVKAGLGGTLTNLTDAHAKLIVAKEALKQDLTFTVKPNTAYATVPSTLKSVSKVYTFKALKSELDGRKTNVSDLGGRVTVCIVYDPNLMGSIVKENLGVYRHDGVNWKTTSNIVLNEKEHQVCGDTTMFSDFGVFGATNASTPNVGG